MDKIDKIILRRIQSYLPIDKQPFLKLGKDIGISEKIILTRLKNLKKKGIIRRIGGNFNSKRLGFVSTLCAANVPKNKLNAFIKAVNSYPGVTHNYRRNHIYNIWFTFIAENVQILENKIKRLSMFTDVNDILTLPVKKLYKIKVDFPL